MERQAIALLRDVIDNANLIPLKKPGMKPNIQTAIRLTVYFNDGKTRNSCATLLYTTLHNTSLEVVHSGDFNEKQFKHDISQEDYIALSSALKKVRFDHLPDQSLRFGNLRCLWLLERATGNFYRSVMFSPDLIEMPYTTLINAIDSYMPEAIREIPL